MVWWSSNTTNETMTIVTLEDVSAAERNYVDLQIKAIVKKQQAMDGYKDTLKFKWWEWRRKRKTSTELVREDASKIWEGVSWYLHLCDLLTEDEADILSNYEAEKLHRICVTLVESEKLEFIVSEKLLQHITKWSKK